MLPNSTAIRLPDRHFGAEIQLSAGALKSTKLLIYKSVVRFSEG
jgi:hypothetical protein